MKLKVLFSLLACTTFCKGSLALDDTTNLTLATWSKLAKTNETTALESLSQHSHLLKSNAFLANALLYNPHVPFIKNLIRTYCFFWDEEHFKQAFIMAARLGNIDIFNLLCETHNLDAQAFLHCIVKARIIASSKYYHFVHNLQRYMAFIRNNIEKIHINSLTCTRCTRTCSYYLALCDLGIPASSKQLTSIWDKETATWIDQSSKSHTSALQAAVDANNIDIATLLLLQGAPINQKDHDGVTALMLAEHRKLPDLISMLKLYGTWHQRCIKETGLPEEMKEHELCKLIRECPALASCTLKDKRGNLLLHKAVMANFWHLTIMLLVREPHAIDTVNKIGLSPFALAATKPTLLKKLLEYAYALHKSEHTEVAKEAK